MLGNVRHSTSINSLSFTTILKSKYYHLMFISEETEAQSKRLGNLGEISGLTGDGTGTQKPILFLYAYILSFKCVPNESSER